MTGETPRPSQAGSPTGSQSLSPHKSRSLPLLQSPGPADYRPVQPYPKAQGAGRFPQARRWRDRSAHTPGPGDYGKSKYGKHIFWSEPGQPRFSSVPRNGFELNKIPGPGDYQPVQPKPETPHGSFSRSQRWKRDISERPGPADYRKTQAELGKLWRSARQPPFSTVARSTLSRKSITGAPHPAALRMAGSTSLAPLKHSASAPALASPGERPRFSMSREQMDVVLDFPGP